MSDISLKEYLEKLVFTRFEAHEREHELIAEALVEARDTMNARLAGMNQFRAQIESNSKEFILRETYDHAHEALIERLEEAKRRLNEVEALQKTAVTTENAVALHAPILAKIESNTKRLYDLEAVNAKEQASRSSHEKDWSKTILYIGMIFTGLMAFVGLLLSLASFVKKG